jgi:hypothetical protein
MPAGLTIEFMTGWELGASWAGWDTFNFGSGDVASSSQTRTGVYSLYLTNSGSYLRKNITARSEYYFQVAIFWQTNTPAAGKYIRWLNGSTALGTLNVDSSQHVALYTGDGTTLRDTGTKVLQVDRWYVIEVRFIIDAESGVLAARVDGDDECYWEGNTGATTVDVAELYSPTGYDVYYDDFVVAYGGWPDRLRIGYLPLKWDAVVNFSQVGLDNDALHFRHLSEYTSLSPSSFCYSKTAGQTESFDISNAPEAADTVVAVQALGIFETPTTTAGQTVKMFFLEGENEHLSGDLYIPPGPTYNSEISESKAAYVSNIWHDFNGTTLTKSLVGGLTMGFKIV